MQKHISVGLAAVLFAAALPVAAEAMPLNVAPAVAASAPITLAAGGCGLRFHRGPMGGCVPNAAVVVVRRPVCRMVLLPLPHKVCR